MTPPQDVERLAKELKTIDDLYGMIDDVPNAGDFDDSTEYGRQEKEKYLKKATHILQSYVPKDKCVEEVEINFIELHKIMEENACGASPITPMARAISNSKQLIIKAKK